MSPKKIIKPVQRLTLPFRGEAPLMQGFGENPYVYQRFGQKGHNGRDYGLFEHTAVLAMGDGVIRFAGDGVEEVLMGASAGICIMIQHEGFLTGYAHLSKTFVEAGEEVKAGDIIAMSGKTGAVTGPHLHVEILPQPLELGNGYLGRVDIGGWLDGEG